MARYKLTTRAEWGAIPANGPPRYLDPAQIRGECWHYTDGTSEPADKRFHFQCAGLVREVQRLHMDDRGFRDIAYNFLICIHGGIFEGRGFGIHSAGQGCEPGDPGVSLNGNDHYHAVCYIAGPKTELTDAAKRAYLALHADLHERYHKNSPNHDVIGHRDLCQTDCPGPVYPWIIHTGI